MNFCSMGVPKGFNYRCLSNRKKRLTLEAEGDLLEEVGVVQLLGAGGSGRG